MKRRQVINNFLKGGISLGVLSAIPVAGFSKRKTELFKFLDEVERHLYTKKHIKREELHNIFYVDIYDLLKKHKIKDVEGSFHYRDSNNNEEICKVNMYKHSRSFHKKKLPVNGYAFTDTENNLGRIYKQVLISMGYVR